MTARPISAGQFTVTRNTAPRSVQEREALVKKPKFGTVFTDHMAHMTWTVDEGWHAHSIEPYAPLILDPATAVLHYAQEVFEGLKAYRWADGTIRSFRPQANAARLARSCNRLAAPTVSEADFLASITALVRTDIDWVPRGEEMSLYLRPFLFASEAFIGVRAAHRYEYLVIASPVGAYFDKGVSPVSIWIDTTYHRAAPGGTGAAKCGGNYAASLLPQMSVAEHGYDQVCFLDAREGTYLEELGGMNVFVVYRDGTLATPELSGTILPGITRESIITLLRAHGREVQERALPLPQLLADLHSGRATELFACGTAAVVTPIGKLGSTDFEVLVGGGEPGPLTMQVRQQLTAIQTGRSEDTFGWMQQLV